MITKTRTLAANFGAINRETGRGNDFQPCPHLAQDSPNNPLLLFRMMTCNFDSVPIARGRSHAVCKPANNIPNLALFSKPFFVGSKMQSQCNSGILRSFVQDSHVHVIITLVGSFFFNFFCLAYAYPLPLHKEPFTFC